MNISAPFIARPVATILLTLGVAAAGAVAFKLLPVASLPDIDVPAIFVSASFPGASPEVMASSIATPLERHLGAIAGVNDMTSTSSIGSTNIQLTFDLGRNLNGAARDVEAAIEDAQADLPAGIPNTPTYRELNTSRFSIMTIAMTSNVLSQGQIYNAADAIISQRLAQIKGVGGVNVNGSALPAVRVEVNPLALSHYGISLQDVSAAISNANANAPKGYIDVGPQRYEIYTNDNARDAAAYGNLIIASRNGAYVRLKDVAQVTDMRQGATENIRTYGIYNGKAAVTVNVQKEPGANVIDVVDRIKAELPMLQAAINNPNIHLTVTSDRSVTIRASLDRVEETLVISVIMVILVVYVFLNSYRSAIVPAVVIPSTLLGTFGAMYLLGFTLDNFSLMALTVATGFLVDDAVVVMENITRHIEAGMPRMQAALHGAEEVGFTVLAMSLSLVAVFIPFELIGGIIGRLFGEFTISLSVAIVISLALSLTTTPMLCARLLGFEHQRSGSGSGSGAAKSRPRAFDRAFSSLRTSYEQALVWILAHRGLTLVGLLAVIGLNVYFYTAIPKGFFPEQDTGQLRGAMRADSFASFQLVKSKFQQVARIIQSDPAVASVTGSVGGTSWRGDGATTAQLDVTLKPISERSASAQQVIARLRPKLNRVSGVQTFLQSQQTIGGGGGGRSANNEYQYTLLGGNLAELRTWTDKLRTALEHVPQVADMDTDVQPGGLQANLVVDRNTAYRLGLTESQIDRALEDSFAQAQISTIYDPSNPEQYRVVMEVAPQFWQNPETLKDLYISTAGGPVSGTALTQALPGTVSLGSSRRGSSSSSSSSSSSTAGTLARNASSNALANAGRGNTSTGSAVAVSSETVVPFAAFSHFEIGTTPVAVHHTGNSASSSISFNLPPGGSLGDALAAIRSTMNLIHMPADIHGSTYGTARLFQQNASNEPLMLLAALLAIYVVLGMLYESYAHPLIILSTLPSGGLGALLALIATGMQLNLVSFLGIIMLIGIVMKNAIMLVDFALDAERKLDLDPVAAIQRACSLRFRPIMMTTCAAIAGALPLAIAWGQGTEMRRPLGVAIVGGLLVSQALTLFTTPVVYLYVHPRSRRKRDTRHSPRLAAANPGAGAGA